MKTFIYPKISIVTPSYNQGKFIERTIKSIINQNYPNLEYIIMDGGSTDSTVKILKKYERILTKKNITFIWKSEEDRGQTHAINKGMRLATGEILSYLNSDDTYEPDTFQAVAKYFQMFPQTSFLYGKGRLIDAKDEEIGFYRTLVEDYWQLFASCGISQPTAFWRREVAETIGHFNESYHYTMDYEFWVRVARKFRLYLLPKVLANSRIHQEAKTSAFTHKLHREALRMEIEQYGRVHYDWVFTFTDSAYQDKKQTPKYYRYMISHSLFNYFLYNHTFLPAEGRKIMWNWLRQCL